MEQAANSGSARHTPGPWVHATDIGQVGSVEYADGTVIAQAQQLPGDFGGKQRNANARLIAAAPDMLEALIDCRRALEIANFTQELAVVDAAIAKARGASA